MTGKVRIVGIGGALRAGSTSEQVLRYALNVAAGLGAETDLIVATELDLPMYSPGQQQPERALRLLDAVRRADGLIVSSPGYHGGISGLLKNALDYLEELAGEPWPYLHGKAVGCIVASAGWQAGATSLTSLRSTVHALRGWPTPLGAVVNSSAKPFDPQGNLTDEKTRDQLGTVGRQVVEFAQARLRLPIG
jgi:FMN reductase